MSEGLPTLDYAASRTRRDEAAPGAVRVRVPTVLALAFSIVAAAPLVGFLLWVHVTHPGGWAAGLLGMPFIVATTILSPIAFVTALIVQYRLGTITVSGWLAAAISLATTSFCAWLWLWSH